MSEEEEIQGDFQPPGMPGGSDIFRNSQAETCYEKSKLSHGRESILCSVEGLIKIAPNHDWVPRRHISQGLGNLLDSGGPNVEGIFTLVMGQV